MLVAQENEIDEWQLRHATNSHTIYNNYEKMQKTTEGLSNITTVIYETCVVDACKAR